MTIFFGDRLLTLQRHFRKNAPGARRLRHFTVLSNLALISFWRLKRPEGRAPFFGIVAVVLTWMFHPRGSRPREEVDLKQPPMLKQESVSIMATQER